MYIRCIIQKYLNKGTAIYIETIFNSTDVGIVKGDMIFPPKLHHYLFNNESTVHRKGILEQYLWPRENGQPTVPYELHSSGT